MAERCELCGARWEVGASACRDCGSKRRITVLPGDSSSASMSGVAVARERLASTSTASAAASTSSASLSGVAAAGDREPEPSAGVPIAIPRESLATSPLPSAAPPLAAPLAPAVPVHVPAGVSQPISRPGRRPALLLLAAVGLGGAIGAAVWLGQPTAEPEAKLAPVEVHTGKRSSCEDLAALAGSWVFTTATTGARRKERLGVRGFYELQLTVDGCTAHASMAKTGRTDRKAFDADKIPRAEATLVQGEGVEAYGFAGSFVLRNDDGQGIDTRFVLAREGERLVGHWRQLGERWATSGLYGVLEGRREGDPLAILPERSSQPCPVRCATPEDIALIDAPNDTAHAQCLASCE